jgi:hypothetical protein
MIVAAGAVTVAFAAFLIGLALLISLRRDAAERFLLAFASSARVHYLEQSLRLLSGGALILYSPHMLWAGVYRLFGWVVVITSIGLLCIPWRWHRRFAERVLPPVIRFIGPFAAVSAALGAIVLYSVFAAAMTA